MAIWISDVSPFEVRAGNSAGERLPTSTHKHTDRTWNFFVHSRSLSKTVPYSCHS